MGICKVINSNVIPFIIFNFINNIIMIFLLASYNFGLIVIKVFVCLAMLRIHLFISLIKLFFSFQKLKT